GMLVGISTALGLGLAFETLPLLSRVLGRPVLVSVLNPWALGGFVVFIAAVVTGIAGVYPGMILTRLQPIEAIKNKLTSTPRTGPFTLRRGLIIGQFVVAQVLIICTLVIGSQMDYFVKRPMGFEKHSIVLMNVPWVKDRVAHAEYFKRRV